MPAITVSSWLRLLEVLYRVFENMEYNEMPTGEQKNTCIKFKFTKNWQAGDLLQEKGAGEAIMWLWNIYYSGKKVQTFYL